MKKALIVSSLFAVMLNVSSDSRAQMLVLDEANLAQAVEQVKHSIEQIHILQRQLDDMLSNSTVSSVPWSHEVEQYLRHLAELGATDDTLIYSRPDLQPAWNETYSTAPIDDGTWLEKNLTRSEKTLETQQRLMDFLQRRGSEFENDALRLEDLHRAADSARGRNQLLQVQNAITAESIRQQLLSQQLLVTLANMQGTANTNAASEKAAREAQERAFLTDNGRSPAPVVYQERGL